MLEFSFLHYVHVNQFFYFSCLPQDLPCYIHLIEPCKAKFLALSSSLLIAKLDLVLWAWVNDAYSSHSFLLFPTRIFKISFSFNQTFNHILISILKLVFSSWANICLSFNFYFSALLIFESFRKIFGLSTDSSEKDFLDSYKIILW